MIMRPETTELQVSTLPYTTLGRSGRVHHERLVVEILDADGLDRRQRMLLRDRGEKRFGDDAAACEFRPCDRRARSEEHTSELQSRLHLVCRLLLEKKNRHKNLAST